MKTKIFIAGVIVLVILLVFVGVRYSDKLLPDIGITSADTQETTTLASDKETTTIKPFVEAKTEIIGGETTAKSEIFTTAKEKETAKLVSSETAKWPKDELVKPLPRLTTAKVTASYEYKTEHGKRIIIRFNELEYGDYLDYIGKVEKAGFADKNDRYHIPDEAPSDTAMFYHSYDGERSFGIYWHGEDSLAGFDCEIVICDYDQAK